MDTNPPQPGRALTDEAAPRRRATPEVFALVLVAAVAIAGLLVANASIPGGRVEGCFAGCATMPGRAVGEPLLVVSLNMLHGFPGLGDLGTRMDLIAAEIRRINPDIVLLQEVPWTLFHGRGAQRLGRATGLNWAFARANGNRWAIAFEEGEAILSRYPLRDAGLVELMPSAGAFEHRVALHAVVETPAGPFDAYSTHLTNGDPAVGQKQAESLVAFVERTRHGPAVIGGDFNALEDSPQIRDLAGRWVDAFRAVNPEDPGLTCCADNPTAGPEEQFERRIDYVFVVSAGDAGDAGADAGPRVLAAELAFDRPFGVAGAWQWASDHVGLLVEVAR